MAIPVSQDVWDGIVAVRASGRVNMYDAPGVQIVADELDQYGLVVWLEEQMTRRLHAIRMDQGSAYMAGLREGFEVVAE